MLIGRHPIHLVMPMSGQGTRYKKAGFSMPKPLIPVNGVPMVERLLECFPESWPAHFVMADNHADTGLGDAVRKLRPGCKLLTVPQHSKGPSFAVLAALQGVPDDESVLVSYCDYGMVWDARRFEWFVKTSECDACLVSYRGFHAHYLNPLTYAYSRMDGEQVKEVREKGSFTANREQEFASCGAYYFKSAKLLRRAIEFQTKTQMALNGEFYTSLTVEALLKMAPQSDVRVFEIPGFFQWGTPDDLRDFEYWERSFAAMNRQVSAGGKCAQILMPMAGKGSRFGAVTTKSKPFITVAGVPMYRAALATLPRSDKTVFVGLEEFADALATTQGEDLRGREQTILLRETPLGQALSTQAGLSGLDRDQEVIVTSCDHGIALAPGVWEAFRADPKCEAAIFVVKGYPLATQRPTAFAYVETDGEGPYPVIKRVSVKVPLSEAPSRDGLLVGTFWFKTAAVLDSAIKALIAQDVRVNGELYLDSALDLLCKSGVTVRMIPLEGYINWGDPDALATALYWREIFYSQRTDARIKLPGVGE